MRRRIVGMTALAALAAGLAAAAPGLADVQIGINIGVPPAPPVVVAEPPRLTAVPGLPVYWAPSLPYNFFYFSGRYYTYTEDAWFWSASVHGPWGAISVGRVPRPVLAVPVAYYKVPPGHWKKLHGFHGPPPWAGRGHGRGKHRKHDKD